MRVLIATDTYPPDLSGSSFFADRLAKGLAERGHDVHVVCASETGPRQDVRDGGVRLHRLRSLPLLIHPRVRFVPPPGVPLIVRRIVAAVRPEVVHTQDHFTIGRAAIRAAQRYDIPVVATNHFMPDNLLPYLPRRLHAPVADLAWRDFRRIYRRTDYVTAPTPTAAALLAEHGFARHVEPVSCGVDTVRFHPPADSAAAIRKELGLPDLPTIAFVGRLDAEKRIDELIRAFARLRHLDAQLVLAGEGTRRPELQRLAEQVGVGPHVHFLGFVPDEQLPSVYQAADVFAIPGIAELQSIATLEALASGLPVVAANAVALPHLVSPGENGFLVEPGDVAGLAATLDRILSYEELRRGMGTVSRSIAVSHGHERTLARFEEIYRAVTAG
ncbi:glycosyltransferase [Saccharomonospora marina XMU15]|uniref:Glycosyltransferase n=1 Tax=Saccharomonospora marina XMU15 TaxID=882083 RepID=H5X7N1_9PSEU|nr:glycosyltransferase [Saccharomonospora marina]EHR51323.1 glycosyltransferase [Saccharomonospora marina XMU15]